MFTPVSRAPVPTAIEQPAKITPKGSRNPRLEQSVNPDHRPKWTLGVGAEWAGWWPIRRKDHEDTYTQLEGSTWAWWNGQEWTDPPTIMPDDPEHVILIHLADWILHHDLQPFGIQRGITAESGHALHPWLRVAHASGLLRPVSDEHDSYRVDPGWGTASLQRYGAGHLPIFKRMRLWWRTQPHNI